MFVTASVAKRMIIKIQEKNENRPLSFQHTSWSYYEKSIHAFPGQVYKGFVDIDGAVNFMSAHNINCLSIQVYDNLGNQKALRDYGHSCQNLQM